MLVNEECSMQRSESKLENYLKELRSLMYQLDPNSMEHQRLSEIVDEIEISKGPIAKNPEPLNTKLAELIGQIEVSHPRITSILNELMVILSGMGI